MSKSFITMAVSGTLALTVTVSVTGAPSAAHTVVEARRTCAVALLVQYEGCTHQVNNLLSIYQPGEESSRKLLSVIPSDHAVPTFNLLGGLSAFFTFRIT